MLKAKIFRTVVAASVLAGGCGPKKSHEDSPSEPVAPDAEAPVWTGQSTGGSDAVVCRQAYATMGFRLAAGLNVYEARTRWGSGVDMGGDDLTVDAKVRLLIERIAKVDLVRAERYRGWFETFWAETEILERHRLPNVAEEGEVSLPGPDCEIRQVSLRQSPANADAKRYVLSNLVWSQLDRSSQAATVLHELVFREAQESSGAMKSEDSRRYGALAIGNKLTDESSLTAVKP